MVKQPIKDVYNKSNDEEILVVPTQKLFPQGPFNGINATEMASFEKVVRDSSLFMWRSSAEVDPTFKQIIPYLIFNYEDKYFLMQRKSNSSEVRLKNKYSLGIGGHIRKEDIINSKMSNWARREFAEEVLYDGNLEIIPLGVLNDESNDVGKVHTGYIFLLKGDSNNIKVRSELKSGQLLTLEECDKYYPNMETWSQYTFNYLKETKV